MKQKIIKVGNSAAVTLPASFVKEGNLRIGDELVVETFPRYQMAVIKSVKSKVKTSMTPEFKDWLDNFIKKHKKLLKVLAKTP